MHTDIILDIAQQIYAIQTLYGEEGLSQAFRFELTFTASVTCDEEKWLGKKATLIFEGGRKINGIITQSGIERFNLPHAKRLFHIILQPSLALLKNWTNVRTFVHKNIVEIMQMVFTEYAIYHPQQLGFQLREKYPTKPMVMQVPNESNFNFVHRILGAAGIFYQLSDQETILFCDNCSFLPPYDAPLQYHNYQGWHDIDTIIDIQIHYKKMAIYGKTANHNLCTGNIVTLNTEAFLPNSSGQYIITAIKHYAKFPNTPYYNVCTFATTFQPIAPDLPNIPLTFPARVESKGPYAHLDNRGRYRIRYTFDRSQRAITEASSDIPYLQLYAGLPNQHDTVGLHFPLQEGASILMGCLYGDPDQPLILGSVPNKNMKSPVNSDNPTQSRIITSTGNELLMEDKQYIALHTYGKENQLYMSKHMLSLTSAKGHITLHSQKNTEQQSQKNYQEILDASRMCKTHGTHMTLTEKGHIQYQAYRTIKMHAKQKLQYQSKQAAQYKSGQHVNFHSQGIYIQAPQIICQAHQNQNISASKIVIQSQNTLYLSSASSGIILEPNGHITIYGNTIGGNIIYSTPPNHLPTIPSHTSPSLKTLSPIPPIPKISNTFEPHIDHLDWDAHEVNIGNTVHACFIAHNFNKGNRGVVTIYTCDTQKNKKILDNIAFNIPKDKRFIDMQVKWIPKEEKSNKKIKISTTDIKNQKLLPKNYYFEVTINHHTSDEIPNALHIQTTLDISAQYTDSMSLPSQSIVTIADGRNHIQKATLKNAHFKHVALGKVRIQIEHADILNSQCDMPYYCGFLNLETHSQIKCKITCLPLFMFYNIRSEKNQDNEPELIHEKHIQHIKNNGNNVTIFIHGYNVRPGKFHEYYTDYYTLPNGALQFAGSDQRATIYRDVNFLQKRFPDMVTAKINTEEFNGTDAIHWYLHMENNLNKAANMQCINYKKFTRLIHVGWSGDPGVLNYMIAEYNAHKAAHHLTKLIQHLKTSGIAHINIIGHSLGCGLLVFAMQQLGMQSMHIIDHAFLWQAAVPNDVFYDRGGTKSYSQKYNMWYLPDAHRAAKKIVVLFSHNDNILGPIPHTQPNGAPPQHVINQHKPASERIMAYCFSKITALQSVYALATWIGQPPSYFFDAQNRRVFYDYWITNHFYDKYGRPFKKTLIAQVDITQRHCPSQFEQAFREAHHLITNAAATPIGTLEILKDNQTIRELITLVHMVSTTSYAPQIALGYSGADYKTQLQLGNKYVPIDQTKWLFSHSGMQIPSKDLIEHVYKAAILNPKNGMQQFGRYTL